MKDPIRERTVQSRRKADPMEGVNDAVLGPRRSLKGRRKEVLYAEGVRGQ